MNLCRKEQKKNMSTKDWKNTESLPSLLTEKWGFSFNLLTESQEEEVVEEATEEETLNEEEEEELDEGAASSGRVAAPDRAQGGDRREDDERKRPMEEAEKPDFPRCTTVMATERSAFRKASKKRSSCDKEEKSDKILLRSPPQLRKHVCRW